jgi:hypothetical protein
MWPCRSGCRRCWTTRAAPTVPTARASSLTQCASSPIPWFSRRDWGKLRFLVSRFFFFPHCNSSFLDLVAHALKTKLPAHWRHSGECIKISLKIERFLKNRIIFYFHNFYTILHFNEFCKTYYFKNFILKFSNFLKISNLTDQFLLNRQNQSPPVLSIFMKSTDFLQYFNPWLCLKRFFS